MKTMKKSTTSRLEKSKQLTLRMNPLTFARLARAAKEEKRSLNQQAILFLERCVHTQDDTKRKPAVSI